MKIAFAVFLFIHGLAHGVGALTVSGIVKERHGAYTLEIDALHPLERESAALHRIEDVMSDGVRHAEPARQAHVVLCPQRDDAVFIALEVDC